MEHTVTGPPQDLEQKRVLEQQELWGSSVSADCKSSVMYWFQRLLAPEIDPGTVRIPSCIREWFWRQKWILGSQTRRNLRIWSENRSKNDWKSSEISPKPPKISACGARTTNSHNFAYGARIVASETLWRQALKWPPHPHPLPKPLSGRFWRLKPYA